MKAFQLPAKTQAKLVKATPHKEFNGPDRKQAISLRMRATLSLAVLRQFSPYAPDMLVRRRDDADTQVQVDGVPPVLLERVAPTATLPSFDDEFSGYTVTIDRAMGDIELYGCTVSKIKITEVTPEGEHGAGVIEWSVGSDEKITPELVGALCELEAGDVWIGQKAPDKPVEEAAAKKARKKQSELEAAGQQRIDQQQTPEGALAAAVGGDASTTDGAGPDQDPDRGDDDGEGEGSSPDTATTKGSRRGRKTAAVE